MSDIKTTPYLFFKGNCQEAMEFYKSIFGGEVQYTRFEDMPDMDYKPEGMTIMHAGLSGGLTELMASDGANASPTSGKVNISLSGTDEVNLRQVFEQLSEGGTVEMPLEKAEWGDIFGALRDKFGVDWMVNISAEGRE